MPSAVAISEAMAAETLVISTPCILTRLLCFVSVVKGRIVAEDASSGSAEVVAEVSDGLVPAPETTDDGDAGNWRGLAADLGDCEVLAPDAPGMAWFADTSRRRKASAVLVPLADRPALGLVKSSELLDRDGISFDHRLCQDSTWCIFDGSLEERVSLVLKMMVCGVTPWFVNEISWLEAERALSLSSSLAAS